MGQIEYDDFDMGEMEMPTPCEHCGRIFDLNDGYGSEKWHPNITICERCHKEEEKEIEQDEQIEDAKTALDDAVYTVNEKREELAKLGIDVQIFLSDKELKSSYNK